MLSLPALPPRFYTQGKDLPAVVTVVNQASNNNVTFSYRAPALVSFTPGSGPTLGGTIITVSGTSFGLGGSLRIGGRVCVIQSGSYTYALFWRCLRSFFCDFLARLLSLDFLFLSLSGLTNLPS